MPGIGATDMFRVGIRCVGYCVFYALFDDVKSAVFYQDFGYLDAFGGLVVFQQGGHDAGQGEGGAVEGVAELFFLAACYSVAQTETVGLVGVEVGD